MTIVIKRIFYLLLVIFLFCLKFPLPVSASTTYYVSPNGSDTTGTGTQDKPFKTIQKGADKMIAGDTCIVQSGTYSERVDTYVGGSAGYPITYQASGLVTMKGFTVRPSASYVTIKGFYITDTADDNVNGPGIAIQGSHCVIEGNEIYYATHGGIVLYVYPNDSSALSDCVIRNNLLHRNQGVGIAVTGRNHLIEGNEVWGTIQSHPNHTPTSSDDADGMHFLGSGHIFRDNYIHDISYDDAENSDNPHIDCFQTWGPAYNVLFERNACKNLEVRADYVFGKTFMIQNKSGSMSDQVHDLTIRNNIFEAFRPMEVFDCDKLIVQNNTFRGMIGKTDFYPVGINLSLSPNASIKNNIFYDVGGGVAPYLHEDTASQVGLDAGYNLIYMSEDRTPAGSARINDQWRVDPLFVNAAAGDYHLSTGSGAIDMGSVSASVIDDFDGISRPQGLGYDIGAFEYMSHCTPLGDIDCSGKVNILDLSALISAFGSTTNKTADLDDSGKVNMIDLSILLQNFGK